MGAVWTYLLFWLVLGLDMTQEEREEQKAEAQERETERMGGRGLGQIGAMRAWEGNQRWDYCG